MTLNRTLILLFLLTLPAFLHAQKAFTLQEAIDYALENSVDMKNAAIDEKIADARVKETVGIGLPQINGTVSVNQNGKLPRFFSQKTDETVFPLPPEVPDGDVIALQNFFQLKSSGDAGLTIDQLLFNGSYLVGLQAANAYKDLAVKTNAQTRENLIGNVTKAFYGALINKERITLFDSNIARVDSLLRNTRAMFDAGFAEEIDVQRVRVNYNNLLAERTQFINLQKLSLELLKFQMNYPMDQLIDVTGDIAETTVVEPLDTADWSYGARPDFQLLEANKKLQELNVKNKYALGLPVLSAYANLGYSTQSPNFGGIFKTETDIEDNGFYGPDKWYPYSSFGLRLNIPIFSGLQRTYVIQQEKMNLLKIENSYQSVKAGIDFEIRQAQVNYHNSLEALKAQQENMDLASNIVRVTRIKYEEGVGSSLEVVQAESDLKEAQVNYYNALYDAMIARVDLEKAYGKLLSNNEIQN